MNRWAACGSLMCLSLLFLLPVATAAVRTVAPDGSGEYPTIQAAIAASAPGDTVLLFSGIFQGTGNCQVEVDRRVSIASLTGDPRDCVLDAQGTAAYCLSYSYGLADLRGITFRNATGDGVAFTYANPSTATASDCAFRSNGNRGLGADYGCTGTFARCAFANNGGQGIVCGSNVSPDFHECVFEDNGGSGAWFFLNSYPDFYGCTFSGNETSDRGGAYFSSGRTHARFYECLFYENEAGVAGGAVYLGYDCTALLDNCTLASNRSPLGSGVGAMLAQLELQGSILAFGEGDIAVDRSDGLTVNAACCDVYGNEGGDYVGPLADEETDPSNFSADPLFCAAISEVYGLHSDSPCAPGHSPLNCGLVGSEGVACGPSAGAEEAEELAPRAVGPMPNPFTDGTKILLRGLGSAGPVRVEVFDMAGRRVAGFAVPVESGQAVVTWDGIGSDGARVPAGVYACRMNVGSRTHRSLLVRLR